MSVPAAFIHSAGLDMIHVPYKVSRRPSPTSWAARFAMLSATPVELKPYLESGKVKPLAVTGRERSPQLPAVPTIARPLPSPPVVTYNAAAPARTPGDIVDALSREVHGGGAQPGISRTPVAPGRRAAGQYAGGIRPDHRGGYRAVARISCRAGPSRAE